MVCNSCDTDDIKLLNNLSSDTLNANTTIIAPQSVNQYNAPDGTTQLRIVKGADGEITKNNFDNYDSNDYSAEAEYDDDFTDALSDTQKQIANQEASNALTDYFERLGKVEITVADYVGGVSAGIKAGIKTAIVLQNPNMSYGDEKLALVDFSLDMASLYVNDVIAESLQVSMANQLENDPALAKKLNEANLEGTKVLLVA